MSKILVIEDDIAARTLIKSRLESKGYSVVEAGNGREGYTLFLSEKPSLILTDIIMPEEEGLKVIFDIRQEWPDLPIIAISGIASVGSFDPLKIAKEFGATAVFSKPLEFDKVFKVIEEHIGTA